MLNQKDWNKEAGAPGVLSVAVQEEGGMER